MEPVTLKLQVPSEILVGVSGEFVPVGRPDSTGGEIIPQLWGELYERLETQHLHPRWTAGVMTPGSTPDTLTYTACVRRTDAPGVEGLSELVLSGGPYVGCEHVGLLDTFPQTALWFYHEYLPRSGYVLADQPHLEIYDERFHPGDPASVVILCAPVVE